MQKGNKKKNEKERKTKNKPNKKKSAFLYYISALWVAVGLWLLFLFFGVSWVISLVPCVLSYIDSQG